DGHARGDLPAHGSVQPDRAAGARAALRIHTRRAANRAPARRAAVRRGGGAGRGPRVPARDGLASATAAGLRRSPSGPPRDDLHDAQRAPGERRGEGFALAHELGAARVAPQAGEEAVAGCEDLGGALGGLGGTVAQRDLDEAEALERGHSLCRSGRHPAGDIGRTGRIGAHQVLDRHRAADLAPQTRREPARGAAEARAHVEDELVLAEDAACGEGVEQVEAGAARALEPEVGEAARRRRRGLVRAHEGLDRGSEPRYGRLGHRSRLPQIWPGSRARAKLTSRVLADPPIRPPGPRPAWYRRLPASLKRVAAASDRVPTLPLRAGAALKGAVAALPALLATGRERDVQALAQRISDDICTALGVPGVRVRAAARRPPLRG